MKKNIYIPIIYNFFHDTKKIEFFIYFHIYFFIYKFTYLHLKYFEVNKIKILYNFRMSLFLFYQKVILIKYKKSYNCQ